MMLQFFWNLREGQVLKFRRSRLFSIVSALALLSLFIVSPQKVGADTESVSVPDDVSLGVGENDHPLGDGFLVSGYGSEALLLVNVSIQGEAQSTFSVIQTEGLSLEYGYGSWSDAKSIAFVGNQSDVNNALDSMTVDAGQTTGEATLSVSVQQRQSGSAYFDGTGHLYEFVPNGFVSYMEARELASQKSLNGAQGYLVTITSEEEHSFVLTKIQDAYNIWISLSDREQEGIWKIDSGPEAGTVAWNGIYNGSAPAGAYAHWCPWEPNDWGGFEDAAVTKWNGGNCWNDLPHDGYYSVGGYVVEYEPEAGQVSSASMNLSVLASPPPPTTTTTTTTIPETTTTTSTTVVDPPQTTTTVMPATTTTEAPQVTVPETTIPEPVQTTIPESQGSTTTTTDVPDESSEEETSPSNPETNPTLPDDEQEESPTSTTSTMPETGNTETEQESSSTTTVPSMDEEEPQLIVSGDPSEEEAFALVLDVVGSITDAENPEELNDQEKERIAASVSVIIEGGVDETVAAALSANSLVLASIDTTQAGEIFGTIDAGSLTTEVAETIVNAVQDAPGEIREVFESAVDLFQGAFDEYKMLDQTITVGERRTVVAVAALTTAVAGATALGGSSGSPQGSPSNGPRGTNDAARKEEEEEPSGEIAGDGVEWINNIKVFKYIGGVRVLDKKAFGKKFVYGVMNLGFTLAGSLVVYLTLSGPIQVIAGLSTVVAFGAAMWLHMKEPE